MCRNVFLRRSSVTIQSLYPSETGRWFHFAISCPSNLDLTSTLWLTHRLADLCYSLVSIITVGTRTSRLQLLPIQRELRSFTPFSIITSIGGHQFLLNNVYNSLIPTAYFILFNKYTVTLCITDRAVSLKFILSYPCKVFQQRSPNILECISFESTTHDLFLF